MVRVQPGAVEGDFMKPLAESMIPYAMKLIGTPYKQLDCQAFIEKCLQDIGINENLSGSNAWYRKMTWRGSPEECRKVFGEIPKGAFLFIVEPVSESTPAKYRDDGLQDASHIGLYTGEGLGAIHSSSSKGQVCESKFSGKTIPNGGWNKVGLWSALSYGEKVDSILNGDETEMEPYRARVTGGILNVRKSPSTRAVRLDRLPDNTEVTVLSEEGEWAEVQYGQGQTGWVLKKFLTSADAGEMVQVPRQKLEEIFEIIGVWLTNE